ncbi:PIF1-like helicase [Medicago truncatula]|uniref:ATP-dependent DNA helicase n=1 Tax=Medicago truncatula TaxID=3880 RepID=A0A072THY1_MEDTR|nr:PIF1-like helicase [Medicago truncatula]
MGVRYVDRIDFSDHHIFHGNWRKTFPGQSSFKESFWTTARKLDEEAWKDMIQLRPSMWIRSTYSVQSHCDFQVNNMCEALNKAILEHRDKPIISLIEGLKFYMTARIVRLRTLCLDPVVLRQTILALGSTPFKYPPKLQSAWKTNQSNACPHKCCFHFLSPCNLIASLLKVPLNYSYPDHISPKLMFGFNQLSDAPLNLNPVDELDRVVHKLRMKYKPYLIEFDVDHKKLSVDEIKDGYMTLAYSGFCELTLDIAMPALKMVDDCENLWECTLVFERRPYVQFKIDSGFNRMVLARRLCEGSNVMVGAPVVRIIPKGTRQEIVLAPMNSSSLWNYCEVLTLATNMRLLRGCITGDNIGEKVYIHRLSLNPSDARIPFKFQRQSLKQVGIYLPQQHR